MSVPIQPTLFNPISGVFGSGQVAFYSGSYTANRTATWTVPPGVGAVRVRLWGGGGGYGGSGGGFAMKAIYDLTGVTSVAITIGSPALGGGSSSVYGGTSSFGSYLSATGGQNQGATAGAGTGGDINYSGGLSALGSGGGGAAGLFGNGGDGAQSTSIGGNGCSGGGHGQSTNSTWGGNGFLGTGGYFNNVASNINSNAMPTSGLTPQFSIDFIATGGGGAYAQNGINGGGGGGNTQSSGGFPAGGGGGGNSNNGGPGLVIVEW